MELFVEDDKWRYK